jgi:hypothetical protein
MLILNLIQEMNGEVMKSRKYFTALICFMMLLCAACQTTSQQEIDRKVAQEAGLPDAAFKRLQEVIGLLSDGYKLRLKSAVLATSLQPIFDLSPSIQADEIWCTVWKSDTYTWGMGVYRKGNKWVDAFSAFMYPNGQVKNTNTDVWRAAGCTNFINPEQ